MTAQLGALIFSKWLHISEGHHWRSHRKLICYYFANPSIQYLFYGATCEVSTKAMLEVNTKRETTRSQHQAIEQFPKKYFNSSKLISFFQEDIAYIGY
jgi:hypothetical protein